MVDLSVPRFGDIVELAHGRLEVENDDAYYFVQDDVNQVPSGRNVSAYWKVERIRHRDEQRGHRYELKFTVAPVKGQVLDESGTVNRSFIVRDEDYPRYFGFASPNAIPMMKKSDQFVDRAVFDQVYPYHPGFGGNRFNRPTQATITLGEYLLQTLLGDSTPKVVHQQQPNYGTNTYRPGTLFNRIKFPDAFTSSSQVPKYYHHIHFQRPSIAPLAPTLPPSPPLIKELHTPASSNIDQDYSKIVDLRGAESQEAKPANEAAVRPQQPPLQSYRLPQPMMPIQPTHVHHHHHSQPQQPQPAPVQYYAVQPQQQLVNNPPPMQPLPQNLVQSIPVFNPQGQQVMLNHIPIAPNHMIQMSQAPIAIPVHLQLVPSQGAQLAYAPQQDAGLVRIMQPAPVHTYFLAPQQQQQQPHHPTTAFVTPKHPNQSTPAHYSPNSIPTTIKYTTSTNNLVRYHSHPVHATPTSTSPTASNHRYAPLPTVQASPAGLREKFTAPAFQPVTSHKSAPPPQAPLEPETAGSAQVDSASPKFQSFGIENAVTPKSSSTTVLPIATAAQQQQDSSFTPSIGHTSSFYSSNFIDESGKVSESGKVYSEPDPLYHKPTSPIVSITTPAPSTASSSSSSSSSSTSTGSFTKTSFTPKYTTYKAPVPSPTIVPPQLETPISSTLKSYHYLNTHDNYDFVPSRVVELAHVKKIPKKGGGKRKNPNHHSVTVTSHKPLKFSEGPDYATHRPESQLSVQLPPPEKDYGTFYGTPKQNHKVQKPKNYVTQPYSSSTTPFPTSLTTPSTSNSSTTPLPATSSTAASVVATTATTTKPFTHYQPYFKNKNEKSDDVITTMRPRLVIKTVYKPYPSSAGTAIAASTEKPVLKWIPKRPRNNNKSTEPSSSTSSSASIEQLSASSEHVPATAVDVKPAQASAAPPPQQQPSARPSLENQVNRLRASRGRSRYTHRRPTPPSANQPAAPQHPANVKAQRMRSSSTTTTTTVKPIPGVTASAFDSTRIDNRPPTEQSVSVSLKNTSAEKSKRDTATEENEILIAEPLIASKEQQQHHNSYEMVKADIKPVQTNATNIILFEASDASVGPTSSPSLHDLTMSIINHARAIANQTTATATTSISSSDDDADLQTNEISRNADEAAAASTAAIVATTTTGPTPTSSEPLAESTIHQQQQQQQQEQHETTLTTDADGSETEATATVVDADSSRSETTVSV